jgi:hypothetical protein
VGYRFTLLLNREVTDDESSALQEAGCGEAVFATDALPTNADVTVTKMEFDDTTSPTLAEAIESALEAVKKVPDLSVPGLTVPAQPAEPAKDAEDAEDETTADGAAAEDGAAPAMEATAGEIPAEDDGSSADQTTDAVGAAAESS